jgi:hypothetical protein
MIKLLYEETHSKFQDLVQKSNQLLDILSITLGEFLVVFGYFYRTVMV